MSVKRIQPSLLHVGLLTCLILLFSSRHAMSTNSSGRFTAQASNAAFDISYDSLPAHLTEDSIKQWVRLSAESVQKYYGKFPLPRNTVHIECTTGSGVGFATASYDENVGGGEIEVRIGEGTTPKDLLDSWTLTHEMIHLGFPMMDHQHRWLAEGIATYAEPIARARRGLIEPTQVWHDMVENMPHGLPAEGDQGLNHTHTWGRTYWGGALYCLAADVQIRKQTKNRYGLEDALRAIANAGGTIDSNWTVAKALAVGDKATSTHVLETLYKDMGEKAVWIDLEQVWKGLGVSQNGADEQIELHADAPNAALRDAILSSSPRTVQRTR